MEKFCCEPFQEAWEVGVIRTDDTPCYNTKPLEGIYLKDRDCGVVDVKTPIKFCPYCGVELKV